MSERDDTIYFAQRAETERKMAARCGDPAIAGTHRRMAEAYDRRIKDTSMPLRVVPDA